MSEEAIEMHPLGPNLGGSNASDEAADKKSKEGSWLKMRVWLLITVALLVAVYLITVVVLAAL